PASASPRARAPRSEAADGKLAAELPPLGLGRQITARAGDEARLRLRRQGREHVLTDRAVAGRQRHLRAVLAGHRPDLVAGEAPAVHKAVAQPEIGGAGLVELRVVVVPAV